MPESTAHPAADPLALTWGRGDAYTLAIAIIIFGFGCFIHRKALRAAGYGCENMLIGIMSSALSLGPLLMILFDPIFKYIPGISINLLSIVINESRITLWFAAFIALINAGVSFFKPR